ncbi:hypothetical protein HK105_205328 [Polyrhizophydium stewartii]|uniref:Uncharacterized protein n=1 Tax=Polyrhizophydium stewartii TaxID=2732419 RepID=A0ABR4N6R2_9FUNG
MFSNTVLSSETHLKPVQVNVCWREASFNTKISLGALVRDTLVFILQELRAEIAKTSEQGRDLLADPPSFLLGKVDHNSPSIRTWMNPDTPISVYDIKQGDELLLKHIDDVESVPVAIPPQAERQSFQYKFDLLVSEAIQVLRGMYQSPQSEHKERFCLYCPHFGMWLDETKTLFSYNLSSETVIELRALSNEFLMRIHLADFDQKIAIKALPSLLVSDVMAMVQHQLQNRKLRLASSGQYGLFIMSTGGWMQEEDNIEKYPSIRTEIMQYRVRYQYVSIWSSGKDLRIPANDCMTVASVLQSLNAENPDSEHEPFALHLPTGERLKDSDFVWAILKELSPDDKLQYRPISKKLQVAASTTPWVEIEVDFTAPLRTIAQYMCRRLGVRYAELSAIRDAQGNLLDIERSVKAQSVEPGARLTIEVEAKVPSATCSEARRVYS